MSYSPKHPSHTRPEPKRSSSKDNKTQKILIAVILGVLVLIIAAALILIFIPGAESGLGGIFSGKKEEYVPETQDGTTIISRYYENGVLPTSGDRHDVDVINGGGSSGAEVQGIWSLDEVTVYEFDGQGRGIMLTGVDNYTFVYSAENGRLLIDYDIDGAWDREYSYAVNGDTLTMSRGGKDYVLSKRDNP